MIDTEIREQTACMMRIRNEAKWIKRSLMRTWEVAKTIVVWDDGSDDNTFLECLTALGEWVIVDGEEGGLDSFSVWKSKDGNCVLHYLCSPYREGVVRPREAINEIRDKNMLWYYCKARVPFTYMLCMDGDEVLTLEAIQRFPFAIGALQEGHDVIHIPFIYLWDREDQRRIDGIYGDLPDNYPPFPRLNFPRLFTIERVDDATLFDMCFQWFGIPGGFHCGSIPRQNFRPLGGDPKSALIRLPIAHYGYLEESRREEKLVFYQGIDPGNKAEGEYLHIVGQPNVHAPGPLQFIEWKDLPVEDV